MPEYEKTVGATRAYIASNDGAQPGDPAKAAAAILAALDATEPPLRLALGGDAIDAIGSHLEDVRRELETWAAVGRATVFDGS